MTTTAARVAGLLAPARDADTADAELVRRFVADRDGPAFGALVRRHGPMVFGVCRRVLRDWHLAEDAFQAAFLVLARRASAITPPGAVAGWLHGVAYRVSKDARRSALRRFNRERPVAEVPEAAAPVCNSADNDLAEVIDAELQKLPAKYRELLVACDLEGRARQPVAESLGIPEGTLSSRLTTARRMLADRLARRGVAPAVVAGIAAGSPVASACEVPPALAASAARIGSDVTGTVPAQVAALADGAIRAMTIRTFLPYAAGLLVAVFAAIGLGAWATPTDPPPVPLQPQPVAIVPEADPVAETPDTGRLLIMREPGEWSRITPDGKTEIQVFGAAERKSVVAARLSPDGMHAVCNELRQAGGKEQFGRAGNTAMTIHHGLGKPAAPAELDVKGQYACWSADGMQLVVVEGEQGKERVLRTNWVYDIETKEKQKLDAANSDAIRDWSPDGTFFLAVRHWLGDAKPSVSVLILDRKGKLLRTLIEATAENIDARLSPDGKRALVVLPRAAQPGKPERNVLMVVGTDGGKAVEVKDLPENGTVTTACWSPDGKKIAFTWQQVFDKPADATECESFLIVSDPDGANQKTVTSMKATGRGAAARRGLGVYDWKADRAPPAKPLPAAGPNRILFFRDGQLTLIDPDGKNDQKVSRERELFRPVEAKLSPDGKRLAVRIKVELPNDPLPDEPVRHWLYVRDLGEKEPGTFLDVYAESFAWSADGTEIAYTGPGQWTPAMKNPPPVHGTVVVATKKKTAVKLPADHAILDWSRDGKYFLTQRANDKDLPTLHLMNRDGTEHKRLTDPKSVSVGGRLSPDGGKLLYAHVTPENLLTGKEVPNSVGKLELRVLDIAAGKSVAVGKVPAGGEPESFCWSPDGKRVAYTWREVTKFVEGKVEDKENEVRLIVCDPDGQNAATLATWKVKGLQVSGMSDIDWR